MSYFHHDSAIIDHGAEIGEETKIWHFCHLMRTAKVGRNCVIGQNCFIAGKIGDDCKLQNNVSIYEGVVLGNGVFCGPSMVFTNDLNPRAKFPKNGAYISTLVGDNVSIGANATIICGIKIGKGAFVGAGSVVTKDVPDYALVYGSPARAHGWICECGKYLPTVFKTATCPDCQRKYQVKKGLVVKL